MFKISFWPTRSMPTRHKAGAPSLISLLPYTKCDVPVWPLESPVLMETPSPGWAIKLSYRLIVALQDAAGTVPWPQSNPGDYSLGLQFLFPLSSPWGVVPPHPSRAAGCCQRGLLNSCCLVHRDSVVSKRLYRAVPGEFAG